MTVVAEGTADGAAEWTADDETVAMLALAVADTATGGALGGSLGAGDDCDRHAASTPIASQRIVVDTSRAV